MTPLDITRIPAAYAGLDTESPPDAVDSGCAPEHANFLLHKENKMVMRGPVSSGPNNTYGSEEIVIGCWTMGQYALVTYGVKSATNIFEPHVLPYYRDTTGNHAQPLLAMQKLNLNSGGPTALTAASTDLVPRGRGAVLGGYVYGYAYYNATTATLPTNGSLVPLTKMLRWNGSGLPVAVTSAQTGAQAVCTHFNRLFVLGSAAEPNTLFYSDVGGPTGVATAADWQDDVTGLTNKIVIGEENDDFGVGLAQIGPNLVIFKRSSMYVLSGYSSSTFNLTKVSSSTGCVDVRTIVEVDDGVYFLSQDGFMFFDGSSLELISNRITSDLAKIVSSTVGIGTQSAALGAFAVAAKMRDNYVMLTISKQDRSTGALINTSASPSKCYMFHTPTRRWTRFSSNAMHGTIPRWVDFTYQTPFFNDGTTSSTMEKVTEPPYSGFGLGQETFLGSVGSSPIPATWKSELINLNKPALQSQAHRFVFNYLFELNAADDSGTGWTVAITRGDGASVLAATSVPNMNKIGASAYLYRRSYVTDLFNELTDFQLTVTWTNTATSYDNAIYDSYIETQTARQTRSS